MRLNRLYKSLALFFLCSVQLLINISSIKDNTLTTTTTMKLLALQCFLLFVVASYASPPLGIPEENLSEQCKTPKCPVNSGKETINLPYPFDCLLYISCGTEKRIETCPDNLVFNKKTGFCDTRENAQCVPCWQLPAP